MSGTSAIAAAQPSMPPLGLIAGAGALPRLIIDSCARTRRKCFVVALKTFAEPGLLDGAAGVSIGIGEAVKGFAHLREAGVIDVVMAGGVRRPALEDLKPDWRTAAFIARVAIHALGDDSVLRAVVREIEQEGFRVVGVDDVAPDLLAPPGPLGAVTSGPLFAADIELGMTASSQLGRADLGQAVVVAGGQIIAREDRSGTDALIARAAQMVEQSARPFLVKRMKPGQDRRLDLPAIGPETIAACVRARLAGIVVEAGNTIVIDRAAVAKAADDAGLFVEGVTVKAEA